MNETSDVVTSTILVYVRTLALFDSGVSHSFASSAFVSAIVFLVISYLWVGILIWGLR